MKPGIPFGKDLVVRIINEQEVSMKHIRRIFWILLLVFVSFVGTSFGASNVFDVDHELYPYYPSLMKWNKSTAAFTPP